MTAPLTFWPTDDSVEWLDPRDAALAVWIARQARPSCSALEIGVWKGGWIAALLGNVHDAFAVGVDPYPGLPAMAAETIDRLDRFGLDGRYALRPDWPTGLYDLIHVDGAHDQTSAANDLAAAVDLLAPGGVVIVDDYRNRNYPGLAAAYYRWLAAAGFRPFAVTPRKAYVARVDDAPGWWRRLRDALDASDVLEWMDRRDSAPVAYAEPSDVDGQPVLLVTEGVAARIVP